MSRDEALERLALAVLDNLPADHARRRTLLLAIVEALPEANIVRERVAIMVHLADKFEAQQRRLRLDFGAKGNGDGE